MRSILKEHTPIPWENPHVVWVEPEGAYDLVEVSTQTDFELEGYFLAHCLGTKHASDFLIAHRVLSLRDKVGVPHATVLLNVHGVWSPYGTSRDLLTDRTVKLDGIKYTVLQVRGRCDNLARWEYYSLVREWFKQHGGKLPDKRHPEELVAKAVKSMCDTDLKYHYGYLLDESVNHFNWAWWNKQMSDAYVAQGWIRA